VSLILDALNRSRQDSEQVPGLASIHPVEPETTDLSWLPWLLVFVLALAVLAIGWLLFDRLPQPAPVDGPSAVAIPAAPAVQGQPEHSLPAAAPPAVPTGVQVEVRQPAKTPPPAQPAPTPTPVDASVAALYQQREQAPAREPTATKPRQQAAAAARQPQAQQPAGSGREEEAVDIEALVEKARAELADAQLAESEVPFLSTLSQQTKDAIPTLMYQRHDYVRDSAGSSVVINGKTLRVGDSTAGVKVAEILPDSVVLEYQGKRFRLRALNSWVNL
jgi:hypothetical protein